MEGLKVYPVESKARLSAFIKLSWKIYKRDKNWVPPLLIQLKDTFNPKKNPYYSHAEVQLFIVERDGEPVGRIAAHINHAHNEFHKDTVGFFGFFECMPDYEAAQMLFDSVTEWLEKRGITVLRGPMNFSTNDECGLLVEGFDKPPFVMMTYNPPYYKEFLEQYGFQKSKDLLAYFVDYDRIPSLLENMMNRLKRRKRFIIRKVNPKKLEQEISTMFELYNQAWQHNWGFVPMDKKEFSHTAQQLKQIADFDMVLIAEVDGTPVGFSLTLPNINQALSKINGRLFPIGWLKLLIAWREINQYRVLILGIIDKYKNIGIDLGFYYEIFKNALRKTGRATGELSWVLEENLKMRRPIERIGGQLYKIYRIYDYSLQNL